MTTYSYDQPADLGLTPEEAGFFMLHIDGNLHLVSESEGYAPASLTVAWSTTAFQSVGENSETTVLLFSREFRNKSMECRLDFRVAHSASMAATRVAASSYRLARLSYRC